jgi:hypothetical protein
LPSSGRASRSVQVLGLASNEGHATTFPVCHLGQDPGFQRRMAAEGEDGYAIVSAGKIVRTDRASH